MVASINNSSLIQSKIGNLYLTRVPSRLCNLLVNTSHAQLTETSRLETPMTNNSPTEDLWPCMLHTTCTMEVKC
jgi:hypothetical protein